MVCIIGIVAKTAKCATMRMVQMVIVNRKIGIRMLI